MTQDSSEVPSPEALPDWFSGGDGLLRQFVEFANGPVNLEAGITLNLSGSLITGTLVGIEAYLAALEDVFRSATTDTPDGDTSFGEFFRDIRAGTKKQLAREAEEPLSSPPNFIHLLDAQVLSPDGLFIPTKGVPWRGRIDHVSGFWMGRTGPSVD